MTLVTDHAAEHIGERGAKGEDRDGLEEVRKCGRVFEGVSGVGIEEAAAVGAKHLDGDLRGHRANGDGLLSAFQRRSIDVSAQGLRHSLPDEEQGKWNADGQEDVERAAGDIDPEIADGLGHARARPRISTTASTMPVAAETKF